MDRPTQSTKSFDFTADATKQLITLSTAITGLTVTFAKDVFIDEPNWSRWLLAGAWVGYLLSVLCGLLGLYALIGTLATSASTPSISGSNITLWVALQQILFFLSTVAIIVFGIVALM